jgi:hypothetical protein
MLVSHHGSRHSLNESVASRLLKPSDLIAVIEPNRIYGLPHQDVLQDLAILSADLISYQDNPLQLVLFADSIYARRVGTSIG